MLRILWGNICCAEVRRNNFRFFRDPTRFDLETKSYKYLKVNCITTTGYYDGKSQKLVKIVGAIDEDRLVKYFTRAQNHLNSCKILLRNFIR